MPDQSQCIPPNAFTAPFLTHHGDGDEAEILRRAGEVLYADRAAQPPREAVPPKESAEQRLMALAEELSALSTWCGGADAAAFDLLERNEVTAAYAYAILGQVGRHLGALASILEEAESYSPLSVKEWAGTRSPAHVAVFRDWLSTMAAVLRRWGPLTRQLAQEMLADLPDRHTRQMMMEAQMESPEVALYHCRDSIMGDTLASTIAELERLAGTSNFSQDDVHRQLDPLYPEGDDI